MTFWRWKKMGLGLLGKKLGMTQIFDDHGNAVPVTVIKTGPCKVIQKKTSDKEGYDALQVGFDEVQKVTRVNKLPDGTFQKSFCSSVRFLKSFG